MTMRPSIVVVLLLSFLIACSKQPTAVDNIESIINEMAADYLFLELSMGNIDAGHVDAYFGPHDIKANADEANLGLDQILDRARAMDGLIQQYQDAYPNNPRLIGLRARLRALQARIAINKGEFQPFDEETRLLFGTVAPTYDAAHFEEILRKIDALLPGTGALSKRVEDFENLFTIPPDRLGAVFDAAIAECRNRTLEHITLDENESFTVEYVSDKPWSGYNWYQGDSVSIIQVNTDLPMLINRAVDLGCHEGYPGHHTFNALVEQNLVRDNGWLEFSLYPLFSPQSVIAEGSGNYGIELAFPDDERLTYEKEVLFPLAGLNADSADTYHELVSLKLQLNFAGNEAARGYLNGDMTREQAVDWLTRYALSSQSRAEQRTRFFDTYRSYVINYNHGKVLVADHVERDDADLGERWRRFEAMLSEPVLPEDLEN